MQISAAIAHRLLGDVARVERRCAARARGGGQRVRAARADRDDAVVRLDEVAGARQQERRLRVRDDQHRLETAQHAVGAPVLRELDGRPLEIAAILFELRLESANSANESAAEPANPARMRSW